tara:strand:- start:3573 stop:3983 length:411 start_codon:yes stop_codon:yes gene_type:complete
MRFKDGGLKVKLVKPYYGHGNWRGVNNPIKVGKVLDFSANRERGLALIKDGIAIEYKKKKGEKMANLEMDKMIERFDDTCNKYDEEIERLNNQNDQMSLELEKKNNHILALRRIEKELRRDIRELSIKLSVFERVN